MIYLLLLLLASCSNTITATSSRTYKLPDGRVCTYETRVECPRPQPQVTP